MGFAAGGKLAASVSAAGGLGLIGGGYGDEKWLREQFAAVGDHDVGCGFITGSLKTQPDLLAGHCQGTSEQRENSFGLGVPNCICC